MTDESIVIVLPLPNKVLSANFTVGGIGGRMMKATATKRYRCLVCEAVQNERVESLPWGKVSVEAEFYYKTNRRRDEDGLMYLLKSAYDGIVDAGIVPDDTPEYMKRDVPKLNYDPSCPGVILTLTRIK